MGVTKVSTELLLDAFAAGVKWNKVLTLGRQYLFVSPIILEKQIRQHNCWPPHLTRDEFYNALCQYPYLFDPLLKLLGAQEVSAIDYSDYEGANIIHDLNQPIPPELEGKFDFVFDGGALEHIFNIPTALKNCMEMVAPGGYLMLNIAANNYFGHGFYQFSPEFFFRTFTQTNGFELERIILVEYDLYPISILGQIVMVETSASYYEVNDPASTMNRALLINRLPAGFMVLAKRTHRTPIFATMPQQSDYVTIWDEHNENKPQPRLSLARRIRTWIKQKISPKIFIHIGYYWVPLLLHWLGPLGYSRVTRYQSLKNKNLYRRVK